MGLRIKKFTEIFNSLATWITSDNKHLSDFNIGSALRTLTESISLQIEEFYFDMKQNVEYGIETAIYDAFGFEKEQATYASGYITISFYEPLETAMLIPIGFTVSTPLTSSKVMYYQTTEEYNSPAGATEVTVAVTCTEIGSIGNAEANTVNNIITMNPKIESVTNTTRIANGEDEETQTELKARFREYLKSLGRATKESIEYGCKTVDGVAGVHVDDHYIGFVNVYVHDSNGDLPSGLKSAVETAMLDYRAAGIEVKVLPVVKKKVNITDMVLVVNDNADMSTILPSIKTLLTEYLNSYSVDEDFYVSDIISVLMQNYRSVIVTIDWDSGSNISTLSNELIVAGDISLSYKYVSDWR